MGALGQKDHRLETCTIITTEANELCKPVHNRTPVILTPENYRRWLNVAKDDPADLQQLYLSNQMRPIKSRRGSTVATTITQRFFLSP